MTRLLIALLFICATTFTHAQVARMWPNASQSSASTAPWQAVDPYGNNINCAGTTTQCLQEFINAWAANGWPAEVNGPATDYGTGTHIEISTPITVPYVNGASFKSTATLIGHLTSAPCITLDSQSRTLFSWRGQIGCYWSNPVIAPIDHNASCAVMLWPHTNTGASQPSIFYGAIELGTVFAVSTNPNIVPANAQNGTSWAFMGAGVLCVTGESGTTFNELITWDDLNGANTTMYGLAVFNQTASWGALTVSTMRGTYINSTMRVGVTMGVSPTNASQNSGNVLAIGDIEVQAGLAVNDYGAHNKWGPTFYPSNPTVTPNWTIILQSVANHEQFDCAGVQSAFTSGQVIDVGASNQINANCGVVIH